MDHFYFIIEILNRIILFYSANGLEAFIGSHGKAISLVDLKLFPAFLRFNDVYMSYSLGLQSIEDKCQLFEGLLPTIREAFNDSKEIYFDGNINQNDKSKFNNHLTLVDYIRDGLLSICDSSRRYKFVINFFSDKNSGAKVIESILKMSQIVQCSNVEIWLPQMSDPIQLPIKAIVRWINQIDRIGVIGEKNEEKFLKIYSRKIQNVSRMCEHLTEVLNILFQFQMLK